MAGQDALERWRGVLARLQRGPVPRGEEFELFRAVIAAVPGGGEAREAARRLLEGAMADSATTIADAQEVMQLLKAVDSGDVDLADLHAPR